MALYRKYRSRSLNDIIGQEHVTNTLKKAFEEDSISHAYLLSGPRGVGKTSTARIIAHEVNELKYDENSTHIDIIEIDAASNRRIEEVRELRDKIHISPTELKYKVYIIDEVHMLTKEAFNALLKTLEEPPEHAIFILATTEAHKLPETIVSRTQRYAFRPVPTEITTKHLADIAKKEKIKIAKKALEIIARVSDGSLRDAISLLDQAAHSGATSEITADDINQLIGAADSDKIIVLANSAQESNAKQVMTLIEDLIAQGASPTSIADGVARVWREQLIEDTQPSLLDGVKQLLQVSISPNPRLQLELALLAQLHSKPSITTNIPTVTSPQLKTKTNSPPVTPKQQKATKTPSIKTMVSEPIGIKDISLDSLSTKWPSVIETAKSEAPGLHAILRQADLRKGNNNFQLHFRYPLHLRKVTQPKTKAILDRIINQVLGHGVELEFSTITSPAEEENTSMNKPVVTENTTENNPLERLRDHLGGEIVQLS